VKALLVMLMASPLCAQTTITSDLAIGGRLEVGASSPTARVDIHMSSAAIVAFQISGVDESPFMTVTASGAVGMGITPSSRLDVTGSGDDGAVALELRNGNLFPASSANQLMFGYNGKTDLAHAIRSFRSTTTASNGLDFLLWTPVVSTAAIGTLNALQLVTQSTFSSVHVFPAGDPDVELEVSSGVLTGGGVVHRAYEGQHSSRRLKQDITYLSEEDRKQAFEDVRGLKHARFRYKTWRKGKLTRDTKSPMLRGLILEDAPASIREGSAISVYDRLTNAELALQVLSRMLDEADAQAASLESP
jgi:hypothetical protein